MECRRQQLKEKILLLQHCALHKYQVIDGQNMCDQITSDRRSKREWSNHVLCIPFMILSGSPNECWLHTCDACIITTWRLEYLRAPLVTRKEVLKLSPVHISTYLNSNCAITFSLKVTEIQPGSPVVRHSLHSTTKPVQCAHNLFNK